MENLVGDFEEFYNFALRFLSYRPRSEKEVRDYLKIKNQKSKIKIATQNSKLGTAEIGREIDKVIQKLKEHKFINDEEFAKAWIESRNRVKPRSLRLIKIELKQKGIDPEIIEQLIANRGLLVADDLENAKKLVEKRIERFRNLPKQGIYQKLGMYLASKGFDWDTVKKSIDEVLGKRV